LASRRSMRRALGFMGAGPLARSVCPVASNPVGDLVHAGFELLLGAGRVNTNVLIQAMLGANEVDERVPRLR
jgi:hypothetical protein